MVPCCCCCPGSGTSAASPSSCPCCGPIRAEHRGQAPPIPAHLVSGWAVSEDWRRPAPRHSDRGLLSRDSRSLAPPPPAADPLSRRPDNKKYIMELHFLVKCFVLILKRRERSITLSVSVLGGAVRGEGVPPGHPEGVEVAGLRVARAQERPRPPPLLARHSRGRGRARGRPLVEDLVVSGGLAADAAVPRGGAQLRRGQRRGRVPAPAGAPAVLGGSCDGANTTFSAAGDIQLSVKKSKIPSSLSPLESKCSDSGWPPLLSLELEELSDLVSMGVWVMMEGEEVRPGGCGVSGVVRQLLGGSTVTTPGPAAAQLAGSGEVSGEAGKGAAASILER